MALTRSLVGRLFDGPIDIVGDVHGEIDSLMRLLERLGYEPDGEHRDGRRLVFLGDLVDRGADSPGVVELVMKLTADGAAQCIAGNHELNILVGRYGHGNGWLLDAPDGTAAETYRSIRAARDRRDDYMDFFANLPLALENSALRVVHACWHDESIEVLRSGQFEGRDDLLDAVDVQSFYDKQNAAELVGDDALRWALGHEATFFDATTGENEWKPAPLPGHALFELEFQMRNPVRVLTTSVARSATVPYFGAGKWRFTERTAWWNSYRDPKPVIIGHFWRQYSSTPKRRYGVFGQDVLAGVAPHDWMGLLLNVYCVDYSVGQLHLEREEGDELGEGRLAALRYPEWSIMHDDGSCRSIGVPGPGPAEVSTPSVR